MASGELSAGVTPISEGGTGATTWQTAIEALGYLSGTTPQLINDLDTALDCVMKARCSTSYNVALHNAIDNSYNFVYVIQLFYTDGPGARTTTSWRIQIAFPAGQSDNKFAFRNYTGSWGSWHAVAGS